MRRLPTALAAAMLPLTLAACIANPAPEIATPAPDLPPAFFYQPDSAAGAELAALMPQGDPAWRALSEAAIADGPSLAEALARLAERQRRHRQQPRRGGRQANGPDHSCT